jgi:hypothetical protein
MEAVLNGSATQRQHLVREATRTCRESCHGYHVHLALGVHIALARANAGDAATLQALVNVLGAHDAPGVLLLCGTLDARFALGQLLAGTHVATTQAGAHAEALHGCERLHGSSDHCG